MRQVYIILLLFLSTIVFSCPPKFEETLKIRVVDYNYNPIPGAKVKVYYQLSAVVTKTGEQNYVYTPEYTTNETGEVEITIKNREENPDKVDCNVVIYASIIGGEVSKTIDLDERPKEILIMVPAKRIFIKAVDNKGNLLDARAVINDTSIYFNGTTSVYVYSPGNYGVFVTYKRSKKFFDVYVEEDSDVYITSQFTYREVKISVGNSLNQPLEYFLEIEDYVNTTGNGITRVELPDGVYNAKIYVEGISIDFTIDTSSKLDYDFKVDLEPPILKNLSISISDDNITIMEIFAEDPGLYASDIENVLININYSDGTVISKTAVGRRGIYQVKIPRVDDFSFELILVDKEGNTRRLTGDYEVEEIIEKFETQRTEGSDYTIYLIIGFIVLIIMLGAYLYFRTKQTEKEEEESLEFERWEE